MKHGMVQGCEWIVEHACQNAVHQSLPTLPEISACMLEIAALGDVLSCAVMATCSNSQLHAHDCPMLTPAWSQLQLSCDGSGMIPRVAISSMQAEISRKVGNDWWTVYQQVHNHHSLTPLYHIMFHVACVYKLPVGGTITMKNIMTEIHPLPSEFQISVSYLLKCGWIFQKHSAVVYKPIYAAWISVI